MCASIVHVEKDDKRDRIVDIIFIDSGYAFWFCNPLASYRGTTGLTGPIIPVRCSPIHPMPRLVSGTRYVPHVGAAECIRWRASLSPYTRVVHSRDNMPSFGNVDRSGRHTYENHSKCTPTLLNNIDFLAHWHEFLFYMVAIFRLVRVSYVKLKTKITRYRPHKGLALLCVASRPAVLGSPILQIGRAISYSPTIYG